MIGGCGAVIAACPQKKNRSAPTRNAAFVAVKLPVLAATDTTTKQGTTNETNEMETKSKIAQEESWKKRQTIPADRVS